MVLWLPLTPPPAATTWSPSTTSSPTARSARWPRAAHTVVFGTGDPDADLMFVGRGARVQRGQAGQAVRRPGRQAARQAAGGDRAGARAVLHRQRAQVPAPGQPRSRSPLEIEACEGHLFRQIELIQPRVVCSLGNFATKLLSGQPGGHHEGARRPAGARARRAHGLPVPDLPSGGRPLHARRCWSGCARTSRRCRTCSRSRCPARSRPRRSRSPRPSPSREPGAASRSWSAPAAEADQLGLF